MRSSLESRAFDVADWPLGEVRRYEGFPPPEVESLPFYDLVPKDPVEQLRWRLYVRERMRADADFADLIDECCRRDILFWVNTVLFVFEPRPRSRDLMFNSWPDQDAVIVWMDECFGVRECGVEKSRGVGLSFIICLIYLWHWLYDPKCEMGMVSRDEVTLDNPKDSGALMWKLDYFYQWLPDRIRLYWDGREWREKLNRTTTTHRFVNEENGAAIFGYAAVGNTMTGGRKTSVAKDEFSKFKKGEDRNAMASTQHVTENRYFISTYKGQSNEFYRLMDNRRSTMLKIVVDWKDNPLRAAGMYTSVDGQLQVIDKSYKYPPKYKFILDGKVRSPWYDQECRKPGATPRSIAEELDRDPAGSVAKLFDPTVLAVQKPYIVDPYVLGELDFDPETLEPIRFDRRMGGRWRLWTPVTNDGFLATRGGPYAIGVDLSSGIGGDFTSNSSVEVLDATSGEQIAEFYHHATKPQAMGRMVVAFLRWLTRGGSEEDAYITFENNGAMGEEFLRVLADNWGNVMRREVTSERGRRKVKKLGYWNNDRGFRILGALESGMSREDVIVHSSAVLDECGEYEMRGDRVVHVASEDSEEDGVQGKAHADCAMAFALAYHAMCDRPSRLRLVGTEDEDEDDWADRAAETIPGERSEANGGWWQELIEESPEYRADRFA